MAEGKNIYTAEELHTAMDKIGGFVYQFYYFIYLLLNMEEGEEVSFEKLDDAAVEKGKNISMVQVKHTMNQITRINKPVTRWRIFPRSINYENQLHVILDDRLEVYSFNHDYFLSQVDKTMGLAFSIEDKQRRKENVSFMEEYTF